jgi:hypothetical protein
MQVLVNAHGTFAEAGVKLANASQHVKILMTSWIFPNTGALANFWVFV